jgi:predicted phosphoadenosine phosphosulfate sulfurtransferase
MSLRRFLRAAQMLKPTHRISDKTVLCQQQSPDHRGIVTRAHQSRRSYFEMLLRLMPVDQRRDK